MVEASAREDGCRELVAGNHHFGWEDPVKEASYAAHLST